MTWRHLLACSVFVPALFSGCIDLDAAVFVDATIDAPEATVSQNALVTTIEGSFVLVLHLGARASGESEVTFSSFSLQTQTGTTLIESLPVSASPASPATVEPGGTDTVVEFTIEGDSAIDESVFTQICNSQPVVISGVIDDSLATSPTPVDSEPFQVLGCP